MRAYRCSVCNYLYDIQSADLDVEGNPIPFEKLPDDWKCPICGIEPDLFIIVESDRTPDVPAK
ncbi:rubredoxin [Candidatus Dependentiae bacterium]|nr:rubredoxin [Candidatus Dependentiae bacterium]